MKTKTTADFLNELKAKHGLKSNYAVAKFLDQTDTAIARWAHGKNTFSDETALKIAELLEYDPAYVMACMAAERSKDAKVKKAWEWTAQHLGGLAAALAILAIIPFTPDIMSTPSFLPEGAPVMGFAGFTEAAGIYIMRISDAATGPLLTILSILLFAALPRHQRRQ